jgi:hypothetical protein
MHSGDIYTCEYRKERKKKRNGEILDRSELVTLYSRKNVTIEGNKSEGNKISATD